MAFFVCELLIGDCVSSMGHHFAPQHYLKAFTRGGTIWAYDKLECCKFQTQVKAVANETGLYTEDLENWLEREVEAPAQPVLNKIRERISIDEEDRQWLAKYIVVQWKRVPKARERTIARLPQAVQEVAATLNAELDALLELQPDAHENVASLRDRLAQEMRRNLVSPGPEIWHNSIGIHTSPRVVDSLMSMNWLFLHTGESLFLTSDNPVFFFEFEGIARPTSELTFPISNTIALWASRDKRLASQFIPASSQVVKEINRRTVFNSTRFVYSAIDESWILPFVTKRTHILSRIQLN